MIQYCATQERTFTLLQIYFYVEECVCYTINNIYIMIVMMG